jgi:calcineurin-like phosphoesterase family protein
MDEEIIRRHNEVVTYRDTVVHVGDFTLKKSKRTAGDYVKRLCGNHIFLKGSHDYWLGKNHPLQIWEKQIGDVYIVACHYAMRTWARSHYNSWQLFGHSHGKLRPIGKSWDIGVDNNNFYPVCFDELVEIMETREDNFNLVKKGY